ncbi:MAG: cytoplasmic protein [Verrucomicrobiaceae bacterium]|nr:cytoplasmic protein [Verrucomicrobiaceae bacterium]
MTAVNSFAIDIEKARAIWLRAQRLDTAAPFGEGPTAVQHAIEHLGYVQIDTINVIERSHHHILYTRIPTYKIADLEAAQSIHKSVFEFWTHALAYVPTVDYRFFLPQMNAWRADPHSSFASVDPADYSALLQRIHEQGELSIRDINDDVLVEKTHPWGSRKPSKRALGLGFFNGDLTISKRTGMLKKYELSARHFGWKRQPKAATENQFAQYLLQRALRAQGIVSIDSICYGNNAAKTLVRSQIETASKRKQLVPVHIDGFQKIPHWIEPEQLEVVSEASQPQVHILSPFDPLVIQRKRLQLFFDYEHRFEAYFPAEKRVMGYFALPVLVGDTIVAALDLKMDRRAGELLIQKWTWIAPKRAKLKTVIEVALDTFEQFQKR